MFGLSADVAYGSKAEKLRLSKCLLLFIKATAANSTRIDAARNKPPHPELIDKFADWLIALSSGGLFGLNSNFLRVNEAHRSGADKRQRFDHPPPIRKGGEIGRSGLFVLNSNFVRLNHSHRSEL